MFIVVTGNKHRMREVPAYLYAGQSVVVEPREGLYGSYVTIVDTGTDEAYRSNYIKERLASGMFGTVMFDTLDEAIAYIEKTD